MKNTKKGFTLVELLVVIAILAILASVAVVGYTSFINRAYESNAKTEAAQIMKAIEATLLVDEEVKVGDYYIVKDDEGNYVASATQTNTDITVDDISDVIPAGSVSEENGELIYRNEKVEVNVFTNEVVSE